MLHSVIVILGNYSDPVTNFCSVYETGRNNPVRLYTVFNNADCKHILNWDG